MWLVKDHHLYVDMCMCSGRESGEVAAATAQVGGHLHHGAQ